MNPVKSELMDKSFEMKKEDDKNILEAVKLIQLIANDIDVDKEHPLYAWLQHFSSYRCKMQTYVSHLMVNKYFFH